MTAIIKECDCLPCVNAMFGYDEVNVYSIALNQDMDEVNKNKAGLKLSGYDICETCMGKINKAYPSNDFFIQFLDGIELIVNPKHRAMESLYTDLYYNLTSDEDKAILAEIRERHFNTHVKLSSIEAAKND